MAEQRLIDAIKLDRKIGELYTTVHYEGKTDDPQIDHRINLADYLKGYERGIIAASRVMRSAEKVDAVPVVRCFECKYCKEYRCRLDEMRNHFLCVRDNGFVPVDEDGFFSCGERKDDGA